MGAFFALGGAVTVTCTWLLSVASRYRPMQQATAAAFRAVATYLPIASAQQDDDPRELVSSETRVAQVNRGSTSRLCGAMQRPGSLERRYPA